MAGNKKGASKKAGENSKSEEYMIKRNKNNEAVRKSREKSKKQAEETKKRVRELREKNKVLEGKIDEKRKTKKFLKDLFLQQTTTKGDGPTREQMNLISQPSSEDEDEIPSDSGDSLSDDEPSSEDEKPTKKRSRR